MISFGLKQLWIFSSLPHPGRHSFLAVVYLSTKEVGRLQSVGRLRELLRDLRSLDGGTPESSPEPSLPSPSRVYHSEQCKDLWGGTSSPDQPELKPGMSIEQLLASVGEPSHTIETILDDQLMSMWMGGPVA
jgi:hypothetical protein